MKIKNIWFGLIVLTIVFACIVLGYGVYESIFKAKEYIRVYQKKVVLNENEENTVDLGELDVSLVDFFIDKNIKEETIEETIDNLEIKEKTEHEIANEIKDITLEEQEINKQKIVVDIKLNHNDNIILEPIFDHIIYDQNNNILSSSIHFTLGDVRNNDILKDFVKEKYNSKDRFVFEERNLSLGGTFLSGQNNDDITNFERRLISYIPEDYIIQNNIYIRIFNIGYKLENSEGKISYDNDMIEFILEYDKKSN